MTIWLFGSDAESVRVSSLLEGKVDEKILIILDLSGSVKLQTTLTAKKIRDYLCDESLLDKICRIDFYTSNVVSTAEGMKGVPDLAEQVVNMIYENDRIVMEARYIARSSADSLKLVAPSAANGEQWQVFDEKGNLVWHAEDLSSLLEEEEHVVKPFAVTYPSITG